MVGLSLGLAPALWACTPTSGQGDHLLPDVANVEESFPIVLMEGTEANSIQQRGRGNAEDHGSFKKSVI